MKNLKKSCWWNEGGRCYIEPCQREENGLSKKKCSAVCEDFESKRKKLSSLIPNDKLIISSEKKKLPWDTRGWDPDPNKDKRNIIG